MKARVLSAALFVLAAFAAFICYHLTIKHVVGSSGASWFEAGCSDSAEPGAANCAAVLASPYAYFPPKHDPGSGRLHIPVALLGLMYYTTVAIWAIGVGVPSRSRAWLHALLTALVAAGLLSSLYFVYLMLAQMEQWCLWCAVTHGANLLIAVCVLLMWPSVMRREDRPSEHAHTGGSSQAPPVPATIWAAGPSARAIAVTLIAVLGFNYAHWNMLAMKVFRQSAERHQDWFASCRTTLSRSLLGNWQQQPQRSMATKVDDSVRLLGRGSGEPVQVVVFSDFECPACQRFAEYFERQYVPLFSRPVRLVFKHFPLDQACNQFASKTLHAHACQAARWAEAAQLLGGNGAFWKAHDFLFARRAELAAGTLSPAAVAQAVGLDAAALEQSANSAEVQGRIAEDIAAARALNVMGTPAVFVEGRPIDQVAKGELPFWQGLAEILSKPPPTPASP